MFLYGVGEKPRHRKLDIQKAKYFEEISMANAVCERRSILRRLWGSTRDKGTVKESTGIAQFQSLFVVERNKRWRIGEPILPVGYRRLLEERRKALRWRYRDTRDQIQRYDYKSPNR
eukprot:Gb_20539 [translate_table: standard]